MDSYFVHKPAVAWVIALFIALFGTMALINLPIEQYPAVAPPSLTLSYTYTPHSPSKSLILLSGSQYFRYKSWC